MKITYFTVFVVGALLMAGCSSTPKVTRVDVDKRIDLSGFWNDYDANLVAQEMITDSLNRPWYAEFHGKNSRIPVVIVGHVSNQTAEHINTQVFTKSLEKELLNSGKVKFVASKDERFDVRDEREDQQKGYTNPETIKKIGMETGADYMLIGSIDAIRDEVPGKAVVFYQANLELVDLTTNEKVWIGQKEIKKLVAHPQFKM